MAPGADTCVRVLPSHTDLPLKARALQVLDSECFRCEYQPIVDVFSERVVAYEALARFELGGEEVAPNLVFGSLRSDPTLFFVLESKLKAFQLAHRPRGARLFLNIDPLVCIEPYQVEHWTQLFRSRDDVVVEVVENIQAATLQAVQSFIFELAQLDVRCALDDVGGPQTLFCFDLMEQCGYLKLDRRWFWRYHHDPAYRPLLKGLLDFARARGIGTVVEGVEEPEHLQIARTLGVDQVQGYLFREHIVQARSPAAEVQTAGARTPRPKRPGSEPPRPAPRSPSRSNVWDEATLGG
jgi:EAL domain-containing protein (putative c-di-GMP-specific phosphodiesterase class I)